MKILNKIRDKIQSHPGLFKALTIIRKVLSAILLLLTVAFVILYIKTCSGLQKSQTAYADTPSQVEPGDTVYIAHVSDLQYYYLNSTVSVFPSATVFLVTPDSNNSVWPVTSDWFFVPNFVEAEVSFVSPTVTSTSGVAFEYCYSPYYPVASSYTAYLNRITSRTQTVSSSTRMCYQFLSGTVSDSGVAQTFSRVTVPPPEFYVVLPTENHITAFQNFLDGIKYDSYPYTSLNTFAGLSSYSFDYTSATLLGSEIVPDDPDFPSPDSGSLSLGQSTIASSWGMNTRTYSQTSPYFSLLDTMYKINSSDGSLPDGATATSYQNFQVQETTDAGTKLWGFEKFYFNLTVSGEVPSGTGIAPDNSSVLIPHSFGFRFTNPLGTQAQYPGSSTSADSNIRLYFYIQQAANSYTVSTYFCPSSGANSQPNPAQLILRALTNVPLNSIISVPESFGFSSNQLAEFLVDYFTLSNIQWNGFDDTYSDGYSAGYASGFASGSQLENESMGIKYFLTSATDFIDTPFFGIFSIGDMLAVFLGVGFVLFFIKMFAGG